MNGVPPAQTTAARPTALRSLSKPQLETDALPRPTTPTLGSGFRDLLELREFGLDVGELGLEAGGAVELLALVGRRDDRAGVDLGSELGDRLELLLEALLLLEELVLRELCCGRRRPAAVGRFGSLVGSRGRGLGLCKLRFGLGCLFPLALGLLALLVAGLRRRREPRDGGAGGASLGRRPRDAAAKGLGHLARAAELAVALGAHLCRERRAAPARRGRDVRRRLGVRRGAATWESRGGPVGRSGAAHRTRRR
mmetsp:Transcript_958/g.3798  ORF Transcript_958/g.3798 Transcript_958/m.3798 type:complete len:253 (+) Transcript_958:157-915(+)